MSKIVYTINDAKNTFAQMKSIPFSRSKIQLAQKFISDA